MACSSDGGVAIRFAVRVAVCVGTAFCGSCALGDGLCSGASSGGVDIRFAAREAVSGGAAVCDSSALGEGLCSGAGSGWVAIRFAVRAAVSSDTAVRGSSSLGDGLSSGVGVGVASAEVSSGVSMMICREAGVEVGSAAGVAVTPGVGAPVAFLRWLGRLASLTEVGCNLFPFGST